MYLIHQKPDADRYTCVNIYMYMRIRMYVCMCVDIYVSIYISKRTLINYLLYLTTPNDIASSLFSIPIHDLNKEYIGFRLSHY